jgi:hypothetical protein
MCELDGGAQYWIELHAIDLDDDRLVRTRVMK